MNSVKELLSAIKKNSFGRSNFRSTKEVNNVIRFAIGISLNYANKLGYTQQEVLNALESKRSYWALNYYQSSRFPKITNNTHIYPSYTDFACKFPSHRFRCPCCNGLSTDPSTCDTKLPAKTKSGICDWKAYGLFGTLGKGYRFVVKDTFLENPVIYDIFKPLELE